MRWVILSIIIFIAVELLLGGVLMPLLKGRFVSEFMYTKLQVILMVGSYFMGGLIVGFISPGIRILEPAIGAAIAVLLTWAYLFFGPIMGFGAFYHFRGITVNYMMFGAIIAFVIALLGADLGERIAARLGNRASKEYTQE